MWRSFRQGAGGPMGGGGIMKTVHRSVSAGTSSGEPFSRSATTHSNSSSTTSPTSRPSYKPSSSDYNSNTLSYSSANHPNNLANSISPTCGDELYDGVNGFYDDYVFCSVPSIDEVHDAVSSLQQVLEPRTSSHDSGWECEWIEPSRSMLQFSGTSESVYDAFHMLQTEPSVKRMVVSLSSDKSVWDAVMNNEAVRELKDSVHQANKSISGKIESSDGSFPVSEILNWIFINIKTKAMEIVEKITGMVNNLLNDNDKKAMEEGGSGTTDPFEKIIKSSFLLSVIVLLIVVVTRANRS